MKHIKYCQEGILKNKFVNQIVVLLFNFSDAQTPKKRGRSEKSFDELSDRSKRRKTEDLRTATSTSVLFATSMSLRAEGNVAAAKILTELASNPTKAKATVSLLKKEEKNTANRVFA